MPSKKKMGSMPDFVKEIDTHSLHILGRCNEPRNWGTHNKQGLVYGIVQSGKTASMISLVGLAIESGYRLFMASFWR